MAGRRLSPLLLSILLWLVHGHEVGLLFLPRWSKPALRHGGRLLARSAADGEATAADEAIQAQVPPSAKSANAESASRVETLAQGQYAAQEKSSTRTPESSISRSLAIQIGLFVGWASLVYTLATAESNPLYQSKVQDTIAAAVPSQGLKVLEVGIGEAPNLKYYPAGTKLVGLDAALPDIGQQIGMKQSARKLGLSMFLVQGSVQKLPFESDAFDAVVMTKVLCSVSDSVQALREVSRVLKPGGHLGYVEHVAAAEGSLLETQQLLIDPLQQLIAGNCHLHRETDGLISRTVTGADGTEKLFQRLDATSRYQVWQMWPIVEQAAGVVTK